MQEKNCSLFPIYPDVERLYFRISPLPIHKWASFVVNNPKLTGSDTLYFFRASDVHMPFFNMRFP